MTALSYIRPKIKMGLIKIGYHCGPSFLVIGAQKAGTSALHSYLSKHPNIVAAREKEIRFFNRDKFYGKGESWYHEHFPLPRSLPANALTFEATPEYLFFPTSAMRIFAYNPRMKFLVLLRNPVERAFSTWNMHRHHYYENPEHLYAITRGSNKAVREAVDELLTRDSFYEFDEAVRHEVKNIVDRNEFEIWPGFVSRGLYYEQLCRYFRLFRRDQFLIIDSLSMKNDAVPILSEVVRFLEVPEYDWQQVKLPQKGVGRYKNQMSSKTRTFLENFYKAHNEKLYRLLDKDFGW